MIVKTFLSLLCLNYLSTLNAADFDQQLFQHLQSLRGSEQKIHPQPLIFKTDHRQYFFALEQVRSPIGQITCLFGSPKPRNIYPGESIASLNTEFSCHRSKSIETVTEIETAFVCSEEICMDPGIGVGNLEIIPDHFSTPYEPGLVYPPRIDYRMHYNITDFR